MSWILLSYIMACTQTKPEAKTETAPSPLEPAIEPSDETPNEPTVEPCDTEVWYQDADGDGFGNPFTAMESCTELEGHVQNNSDCNDDDPEQFPAQVWHQDADGDGYGDPNVSAEQCNRPIGYILNAQDCNDLDSTVNPDAVWYADADGDGFGDANAEVESCSAGENTLPNAQDCNDNDPMIHPNSIEICDFIDNDCDGLIDDDDPNVDEYTEVPIYEDLDLDGVGTEYLLMACASTDLGSTTTGDCDDTDPDIYPGNFEWPDDTDQNCDGESYFSVSQDILQGIDDGENRWKFGGNITTGDMNDDGVLDVFVSLPEDNSSTGKVFWVDGTSTFDLSDMGDGVQSWTGATEGEEFGEVVAVVGDLTGDGLSDALMSSIETESVYLFHTASVSGTIDEAEWHWQLPESNTGFGTSILSVGDIDGDGFSEALVGAPTYKYEGNNRGAIFLLDNDQIGTSHNPADGNHIIGDSSGWSPSFGANMALVKDANGDGIDEVMVSTPSAPAYSPGLVHLYQLSDLLSPETANANAITFQGEMNGQKAGSQMHGLDDFNGDGYADLMLSGNEIWQSTTEFGKLFIIYGKTTFEPENNVADADVQLINDGSLDYFADNMISPGDLNADGLSDILFSSMNHTDLPDPGPGIVFGVFGSNLSGTYDAMDTADFAITGNGYYYAFGSDIAAAGDLDEDGFDDFWVGQQGTSQILLLTGDILH